MKRLVLPGHVAALTMTARSGGNGNDKRTPQIAGSPTKLNAPIGLAVTSISGPAVASLVMSTIDVLTPNKEKINEQVSRRTGLGRHRGSSAQRV